MKKNRKKLKNKGITLVEVLVSMVIIMIFGIVAVSVFPTVRGFTVQSEHDFVALNRAIKEIEPYYREKKELASDNDNIQTEKFELNNDGMKTEYTVITVTVEVESPTE